MTETTHTPSSWNASLANFTGSEQWYCHSLARRVLYTDGAKYVAESAAAYWLLDEIALSQIEPAIKDEEFQVWRLKVNPDSSAALTCDDGNNRVVFSKKIEYTDFPFGEVALYCTNNVILLPSEY